MFEDSESEKISEGDNYKYYKGSVKGEEVIVTVSKPVSANGEDKE